MPYNLITILGPTATGKTRLAVKAAKEFSGEIISADSRQVYRGMNIGTGKDLEDYRIDETKIQYHLIDIIDPSEEFDLFKFNNIFYDSYNNIIKRKKIPFLVGGSGLYISSILQEYKFKKASFGNDIEKELNELPIEELQKKLIKLNPALHNTTDLIEKRRLIKAIIIAEADEKVNHKRPDIKSIVIGILLTRSEIKKRITERLKKRLESGMIDEVQNLLKVGITYEKLNFFGLEYKYIGLFLKKELNYNDMFQKLNSAIHNFAKRQMTWFRKMEKEGIKINWIDGPDFKSVKEIIEKQFYK